MSKSAKYDADYSHLSYAELRAMGLAVREFGRHADNSIPVVQRDRTRLVKSAKAGMRKVRELKRQGL